LPAGLGGRLGAAGDSRLGLARRVAASRLCPLRLRLFPLDFFKKKAHLLAYALLLAQKKSGAANLINTFSKF
jgi:hypothetical protein